MRAVVWACRCCGVAGPPVVPLARFLVLFGFLKVAKRRQLSSARSNCKPPRRIKFKVLGLVLAQLALDWLMIVWLIACALVENAVIEDIPELKKTD